MKRQARAAAVLISGVAAIGVLAPAGGASAGTTQRAMADSVTCLPASATVASAGKSRRAVPERAAATALPSIPWGIDYDNDGADTTGNIVTADINQTEADDGGVVRLIPPLVDVFNNMLEGSVDNPATQESYDQQFPTAQAQAVWNSGATPMLTTQWDWNPANITSGADNTILTDWADCAEQFGHTVLIRPWRELNGGWYPWAVPNVGAAEYVAAWRDAYNIIHPIAPNVLWVWNISTGASAAHQTETYLSAAYPGNGYVNYISFDSYVGNTETSSKTSEPWTDTQPLYSTLTTSPFPGSTKPVMVAEFSIYTSDAWLTDSTRAAWITNTFHDAASDQPGVVSMDWFNGAGPPDGVAAFDNTSYPLSQEAFDEAKP
jgi:hypothetical protein